MTGDRHSKLVGVVHLENSLKHLSVIEQLIVLRRVLNRSGVLNEALEQVVVLGEQLDSRVEDGTDGAATELESQVLVIQIQAFELNSVSVNTARRDDAKVANDLDSEVECRFGTNDFKGDIGTSTLCSLLESLDRVVVGEVKGDSAMLLSFSETFGDRIDGVDCLEEGASSRDGAKTDGAAADDDGCHILSLGFVEHGVGIVGDKVTRGEDVGGEKHDLVGNILRDRVQRGVCERYKNVLGLSTVQRNGAKDTRLGASTGLSAVAEEAITARDGEGRDNLVTLLPVLDSGASLVDLADELVAEDEVVLGDGLMTTVDVQVGTTEGSEVDLDDNFALAGFGDGALENSDLLGTLNDDSFHGSRGGHVGRSALRFRYKRVL